MYVLLTYVVLHVSKLGIKSVSTEISNKIVVSNMPVKLYVKMSWFWLIYGTYDK